MAQPVAFAQWTSIGTVGTVLLTDRSDAALINVVIPGTYVGTVTFYDSATTAGTSATNQVLSLGIPNTNVGGNVYVGARLRNGLVYASTGTPAMTVIWD